MAALAVIVGLQAADAAVRWQSTGSVSPWLVVRFAVGAVLLAGFVRGSRLAWKWGRSLAAIGGVLLLPALFVTMTRSSSFNATLVLVFVACAWTIVLGLSLPSARAYFGLVCPKCGAAAWRAADLRFSLVKCPRCGHLW